MPRKPDGYQNPASETASWRCTPAQKAALRALLDDRGIHPSQVVSVLLRILDDGGEDARLTVAQRLGQNAACPSEVAYREPCSYRPARRRLERLGASAQHAAGSALLDAMAGDEPPQRPDPAQRAENLAHLAKLATSAEPLEWQPQPDTRQPATDTAGAKPQASGQKQDPLSAELGPPDYAALRRLGTEHDPCPVYRPGQMSRDEMQRYQADMRAWRARNPGC